MKSERIYAPKVSNRLAKQQAISDIGKEQVIDWHKSRDFGSIQNNHILMTPKTFATILPEIQVIQINENNQQYFKKSNKL